MTQGWSPADWAAYITAIATGIGVIVSLVGVWVTLWANHKDRQANLKNEVLKEKREAFIHALHVVDLVHHNAGFVANGKSLRKKPYDINVARDAVNKIILYSDDPERMLSSFYKAIGLMTPGGKPVPFGTGDLNDFRNEIARELGLRTVDYSKFFAPWIFALAHAEDEPFVTAEAPKHPDVSDAEKLPTTSATPVPTYEPVKKK